MKLSQYLSATLATGAFLLAGSLVLARTASAAKNMHPRHAANTQSSDRQAHPESAPGVAVNEQGSRGQNGMAAQSIAVDHAGGNGVRRMDGGHFASGQAAESGISSGSSAEAHAEARKKKHLAGVKYEDRMAGDNPGGIAGQVAQGSAQRKDGSIVHADFPRSADRNSAHATESLSPSNKARTGENPLHETGGTSGTNPLYGGRNNARGMVFNKQGSSSAPVKPRH